MANGLGSIFQDLISSEPSPLLTRPALGTLIGLMHCRPEIGHCPKFPKFSANARVDVAVIGGGMTGLTAAYLLKRAGKTV